MPRFDGTGPDGRGPMTGGGRGRCTSKEEIQSDKDRRRIRKRRSRMKRNSRGEVND